MDSGKREIKKEIGKKKKGMDHLGGAVIQREFGFPPRVLEESDPSWLPSSTPKRKTIFVNICCVYTNWNKGN
ncbi:hypothetical protein MRB53_016635 [Persea americana]|uniref:Uncharacterized protein n=1 Tax=Persea americana TaxID=3435 RepID=A0ACC2M2D1_PERAE|nr:hypothetical protein MRB53_016635 [Persea americana]